MSARSDAALRVLFATVPGGYGSRVSATRVNEFVVAGEAPVYRGDRVTSVSEDGVTVKVVHGSTPVQYRRTKTKTRRTE